MCNSDKDRRPLIPTELRRRVLVEAGHRCAIATCRHIDVEVHHIIPWSQCQTHDYNNLIALCPNCHSRADRGDIDRKSLRLYKLNLRFAHDKYSQLEIEVLFELFNLPEYNHLPWLGYMLILLKRLIDSDFIIVIQTNFGSWAGNVNSAPVLIAITPKGRDFISELGLYEL